MHDEFEQREPQLAAPYGAEHGFDPIPIGEAANVAPEQRRMPENRKVRRELLSIHIFLIVISGTIGMGLFDNSGEILRIAGPAGGITAFGIVGIAVILIMEGIAEMIAHWPISNAMFEFVKRFVDKELAMVVGFAYWLAYSVSFGTLVCAASNLAASWTWPTTVQDIVFIFFAPLGLLFLNCFGVKWYGNVEALCGILKIFLVLGSFIIMCIINKLDTDHAPEPNGRATFINAGFQTDHLVASHPVLAIFVALPIATYAYIGVEIVAVTAVEAKTPKRSLKMPARNIAWITGLFYFVSVIVFYFNVSFQDPHLPGYHLRDGVSTGANSSMALIIIAAENSEVKGLPTVLSIFLIIAVLSAANTALYVASRTLWGVACDFDPQLINSPNRFKRWFSRLSTTTPSKVPGWALFVSCISFIWIPIWQGINKDSISSQNLQQVMSGIATVGVVLVWASQCWAFIRYRAWLRANRDELVGAYAAFDHFNNDNHAIPFNSIVGWMQTFPAWIGLIFCFVIVFIFSTTSWWNHKENKGSDIPAAFAAPTGFLIFWVILKFIRWYRAVDTFELYIPVGTWIGPAGQDGLKTKLDGLTAAIKSLEDEQNDPATQLRDISPGSSLQQLQHQRESPIAANYADGQVRSEGSQTTLPGNVSEASFGAPTENTGVGAGYQYPSPPKFRNPSPFEQDRRQHVNVPQDDQYPHSPPFRNPSPFTPNRREYVNPPEDPQHPYNNPYSPSQAIGSGAAQPRSGSPPRRRTSLYTDPRHQSARDEGEGRYY